MMGSVFVKSRKIVQYCNYCLTKKRFRNRYFSENVVNLSVKPFCRLSIQLLLVIATSYYQLPNQLLPQRNCTYSFTVSLAPQGKIASFYKSSTFMYLLFIKVSLQITTILIYFLTCYLKPNYIVYLKQFIFSRSCLKYVLGVEPFFELVLSHCPSASVKQGGWKGIL